MGSSEKLSIFPAFRRNAWWWAKYRTMNGASPN